MNRYVWRVYKYKTKTIDTISKYILVLDKELRIFYLVDEVLKHVFCRSLSKKSGNCLSFLMGSNSLMIYVDQNLFCEMVMESVSIRNFDMLIKECFDTNWIETPSVIMSEDYLCTYYKVLQLCPYEKHCPKSHGYDKLPRNVSSVNSFQINLFETDNPIRDTSTSSNYEQISVLHYALEWIIDYQRKCIVGYVEIELNVKQDTNSIILDVGDLMIHALWCINRGKLKQSFHNLTDNRDLGKKLSITTDMLKAGERPKLRIRYDTIPDSAGLQFLMADQTASNNTLFLFSQCQKGNARSMMPCMDTPSVKSTFDAVVHVPVGLTCLMSAINYGSEASQCGNYTVYSFKQAVPIPSFLLAVVVGNLERKVISDRCAVWSEPSQAEAALYEFGETEKILKVAEDIAGPYVWGRYDLVVLPSTFPFGGMENPCLTFITPTLLAGDRSLVNVIAHEIAHSWTGNLVTNFSWEDFWLNEGFAVFLERKIHGRIHGELERQFESENGFEELERTVDELGLSNEDTILVRNLKHFDLNEAVLLVACEKGSALLFTIEQKIGDNTRFEQFLKNYIQKYAYKTVSTEEWKECLYDAFSDKKVILDNINWDLWLHKSGLPPKPEYNSTIMHACKDLASKWTTEGSDVPTDGEVFQKMSNSQKLAVIDAIRVNKGTFGDRMPALTATYKLDQAKNAELKFSWLMLGLETKWTPIVDASLAFALAVGRMKYCKPIYKSLFGWSTTRERAVSQFKANIPNMHPITVKAIQSLLK